MYGGGGFRGRSIGRDAPKGNPASIKRIAKYLALYCLPTTAVIICIVITSALGLIPPLIVRAIIDSALPHKDIYFLNMLIFGMVGAALFSGLVGVLQGFLNSYISQHIMYDMRVELYKSLQTQSMAFYTNAKSGELTSRVTSDVGAIEGVVSGTLASIVSNLIVFIMTLALMLSLDWKLTLVSVAILPLLVLPTLRVGRMRQGIRSRRQQMVADMTSHIQETLSVSGALLIKAFGREKSETGKFNKNAGGVMSLSIRESLVGRWFFLVLALVPTIGTGVIYWFGGRSVIDAGLTLGTIVAFVALLGRLYSPATSFASLHVDVVTSLVHFGRVFQYLDMKPDIEDRPNAKELPKIRGNVQFDNVSFEYVKDRPVLKNISFEIQPGQLAALVGPTGSGKTTITSLVPRLYEVTSGRVVIDSNDVRDVKMSTLRSQIGIVTQETFLFHSSIKENLLFPRPDATEEEMIKACQAANIHEFITSLADGYNTVVGERGYRLSGGEKQRVAIARVLLKDPRIIIMDEATSSLDSHSERLIQAALQPLLKGRTSMVIAHRLSTILSADVILVLDKGKLVERGTHYELLKIGGLYAKLYEEQFKPRALEVPAETKAVD
ncbi:MAG: ABC transporter ATP-binding protein [Dehalococcoidia bacterium]|nr:ABC transporter ATP-binding protein [Dehalococcoidia bacterium]